MRRNIKWCQKRRISLTSKEREELAKKRGKHWGDERKEGKKESGGRNKG